MTGYQLSPHPHPHPHPHPQLRRRKFHSFTSTTLLLTENMASLVNMAFVPAPGRVFAATAAKGSSGSKEEKSLLDWILGGLQKNQLVETDPILKKVEEKASATGTGTGTGTGKNSVSIPPKKKGGGFGGLFAKNN